MTLRQCNGVAIEFAHLPTNAHAGAFAGHRPDTLIDCPLSRLQQGDTDTDATVRSLVSAGNAESIALDYYLEQTEGAWKVVDFAVFGVRMVENCKGQFRGVVASSGVDGLIKTLNAKNDSNEARNLR